MFYLEPEIEASLADFLKNEPGTFLDEMEAWAMEDDFNTYLFNKWEQHNQKTRQGNAFNPYPSTKETRHEINQSTG